MVGVLLADLRAERAGELAAVGDDEDMSPGDNLKKVGVDRRTGPDSDRELLGKFARECASRVFVGLGPAAGQLPFVPGVVDQHDLPINKQHAFD